MRRLRWLLAFLGACCVAAADFPGITLADYALDRSDAVRFQLPGRLEEISGLARTRDGRILAHNDEEAIVFELDPVEGRVVKSFAIGLPPLQGDFEGIASVGSKVYLITSRGVLLEAEEGADREFVRDFRRFETGLHRQCEVEGLAYDPVDDLLVIACKEMVLSLPSRTAWVHRWSIAEERLLEDRALSVDIGRLWVQGPGLHPSGIAVHPETGRFFLVAARQNGVVEIGRDGRVVSAVRLPKGRHVQAEGIAFSARGDLLVADEAGRRRRAQISLYPRPEAPPRP